MPSYKVFKINLKKVTPSTLVYGATHFQPRVSPASMFVTSSSSSSSPLNKVTDGRDHMFGLQPFQNVTAVILSSHWLLSVNTSQS